MVKMKTNAQLKARGSSRVNSQQVIFGLKQRVILALNKLSDRDTYQIGVEELEKVIECLTPEGLSPFLSCILDTDSEQKTAVRKESIRLMGLLATFHEDLVASHLGKMVASIVKRLKDPDSVVRDACVETAGVLALKLGNSRSGTDGVFVVLVKPLFEALGEQNKQVQFGSALCLAKIIDKTNDPPVSILQRMLSRTVKLLKNPHFMAKPAVIELNRSIIQAGGATTQTVFSAALNSIQETLKNSDWATRRASSLALGEIASTRGLFLGSYRASCIRALESCRFDKVKPVRDSIQEALQSWKSLPEYDTPEMSEAESSIKENYSGGDKSDITFTTDSIWNDVTQKKIDTNFSIRRSPLGLRTAFRNHVEHDRNDQLNDWHIEIALPKTHSSVLADPHNEESEGSSTNRKLERLNIDGKGMKDVGDGNMLMDDKQACSSICSPAVGSSETKFVKVARECFEGDNMLKPLRNDQQWREEEVSSKQKIYSEKVQDRRSLDSTITSTSCQNSHGCCSQTANDMASIRKQLVEIELKQSNLMELLQVSTGATMDRLSMIQEKVLTLESVVDKIAGQLFCDEAYSDTASTRLLNRQKSQSQNAVSPRLSSCTPRPSVELCTRQTSLLSVRKPENWEDNAISGYRSSSRQGVELGINRSTKITSKPVGNNLMKSNAQSYRQKDIVCKNSLWIRIKGYLCEGDMESAYAEALSSGNELTMIELLDRTGPVLESLSQKTMSEVLCMLASYIPEHRFMSSILPWLQQVVDLSTTHGPNFLPLSPDSRRELLSDMQEALKMNFVNLAEKRCVAQLASKLQQIWGRKLF